MNHKLITRHPLSILLIIAIWVVCMIPVPETPLSNIAFIDKWTHFVMYGTLTLTIWAEHFFHALRDYRRRLAQQQSTGETVKPLTIFTPRLVVGGIILPIVMGILVELAQAYLTTCRSGEVFDAICNTLGVLLGVLIASIIVKNWKI